MPNNIVSYINALTAGLFDYLTALPDDVKNSLVAGNKVSTGIGESVDNPFAGIGLHSSGIEWVQYGDEVRDYLDKLLIRLTPDEISQFEEEISEYVNDHLHKTGFGYLDNESVYTVMFKRLDGDLSKVIFAIRTQQPIDWSDVDTDVLEATLTKVIALSVYLSVCLEDKMKQDMNNT